MKNSQSLEDEIERLRSERDHFKRERDLLRGELEKHYADVKTQVSTELQTLIPKISNEIRNNIFSQLKIMAGVLLVALTIATAGGFFTLSGIIDNAVNSTIQTREQVFEKLRESAIKALAESQVTAEKIKAQSVNIAQTIDLLEANTNGLKEKFDYLSKSDPAKLAEQVAIINSLSKESKGLIEMQKRFESIKLKLNQIDITIKKMMLLLIKEPKDLKDWKDLLIS